MRRPQGKLLHRSSCTTDNLRLFLFFQSWTETFIPAFKISKFAIKEAASEANGIPEILCLRISLMAVRDQMPNVFISQSSHAEKNLGDY